MNFLKIKRMLNLLYANGARAILLTGGEPLLRKDFNKIIEELKKYDFKIFLDTNGDYFFKFKDLIIKNIDIIGLPVDFSDSSYRNRDNLRTVIKILRYFKNLKSHPRIRIGTVVTKDNFKNLEEVGSLLKNYTVDVWKLYQFTPQEVNALKNRESLEVTQGEFDEATENIKNSFSPFFKVIISKRENRTCAYFFVNPDGIVLVPVDDLNICRQKIIGNIFDKDIFNKWRKVVSKDNYLNNATITFDYKFET